MNRMESIENITNFVFAGKSIFTIQSARTGARHTFQVRHKKDSDMYFVSLLTGSNNDEDYEYLCFIREHYNGRYQYGTSKKSCRKDNHPAHAMIKYLAKLIETQEMHPQFEFYHEGKCARCGKTLTDPISIERGLGPTCVQKA